ncbi:hypothetical protein Clacol_006066 [Clathrus columnatus]|uniref:tripeptidyl-peptidase II n=1 Tax=Clathrus columnatus TaxID=1419009 RepID=A0AAV5AFB9_9AGAM|nr:hypothetical protein Clacol_006066 [Clathrus columnatus]
MFSLRSLIRLSFFSLGLGLIYSSPLHEQLVVHRQLDQVPEAYVQIGKPDANHTIQFTIGLTSPNMSLLETRLLEISDPNNPDYGQHLTKEEIEVFVRPQANVTMAFNAWLSHHEISPRNATPTGNRLSVEMTVSQAEQVFNATFNVYNHTLSGETIIRTKRYSVPESLAPDISFVHPSIHFPKHPNTPPRHARSKIRPVASSSNNTKTIRREACGNPQEVPLNCAMELYNIPTDTGVPPTDDGAVILSFLGQTVQGADVASFMKRFRPDVELAKLRLEIVSIDGGDNPQGASMASIVEADLDTEMLLGITPNSRTTVLTCGPGDVGFSDSFSFLLQQKNMGTVVSHTIDEADIPVEMLQSVCHDIMQITANGTTVVVASGDGGVGGIQGSSCTGNFVSEFPASCPWALAVGATQLTPDDTEMGAALSGGGFSDVFSTPPHQVAAVESYLKQINSMNSGRFNTGGRAIPDLAAIGSSMEIVLDSGLFGDGGTSVSAPLVAGMIAALNDHRRAQNKGPLGFIQPLIYANADAFTDIIEGSNPGCGTNGFPALKGWDAVGATQLAPDGTTDTATEFSGSGVSSLFDMPVLQSELPRRRAYPKISQAAIGLNMEKVDGSIVLGFGTSISTPIVVAMIATISDHRRTQGNGPVGFINLLNYASGSAFSDIAQDTAFRHPAVGMW